MKNLLLAALVSFGGVPASAAVTYTFETHTDQLTGSFSITFQDFFNDPRGALAGVGMPLYNAPVSLMNHCEFTIPSYKGATCGASSLLQNNVTFAPSLKRPFDIVLLWIWLTPTSAAFPAFYFPENSFSHAGHYETLSLGPALPAVLDVKVSDIPEPFSWSMMIAGFGLIGSALRVRRTFVKTRKNSLARS